MPFLETFLSNFPVLSVINATQSVCVTAPVVAIGDTSHAIPGGTTAADLLHRAADAGGNGPWGRGEHALVIEQRPTDAAGMAS